MGDEGHDVRRHWEARAAEWIAWTRADGHDAFWSYRDRFREFLPTPGLATLDLGCGEGRISRELRSLGHRVTAVDISWPLVRAARDEGSATAHVQANAGELPFGDGVFDRVVAYNVLMDVSDLGAVTGEIGRVLGRDGVATISILHPFIERGRFTDTEPGADFVVGGNYLQPEYYEAVQARDGLEMHFSSWARSLQDYVGALADAGLAVTQLVEPTPAVSDRRRAGRWSRLPLFCWINVEHRRRRDTSLEDELARQVGVPSMQSSGANEEERARAVMTWLAARYGAPSLADYRRTYAAMDAEWPGDDLVRRRHVVADGDPAQ